MNKPEAKFMLLSLRCYPLAVSWRLLLWLLSFSSILKAMVTVEVVVVVVVVVKVVVVIVLVILVANAMYSKSQ